MNSIVNMTDNRISELENRSIEFIQWEQKRQNRQTKIFKKWMNKILWGNNKRSNIHIIRVPKGDKEGQWAERVFEEIMPENFPNLVKNTNL